MNPSHFCPNLSQGIGKVHAAGLVFGHGVWTQQTEDDNGRKNHLSGTAQ